MNEEPKVSPDLVATLPETSSREPATSTSHEVNEVASSEEGSASSTSPEVNEPASSEASSASSTSQEPAELAEEPTPILFERYIQPLVRADITMVELRNRVGHEKGKSWTSLLNRIVDRIVELQNSHATSKQIYATLLKEHGTKLGTLVMCILSCLELATELSLKAGKTKKCAQIRGIVAMLVPPRLPSLV